MLDKILKILDVITQVILLLTSFLSIFMAYIIFAPDELPKPFRLQYQYDTAFTTPVPQVVEHVAEATAAAESHDFIPGEGMMLNMPTKIINLVDPTGRKYIRVTIVSEFAPDDPEYESLPEEEKIAYLTAFEEKLNSRLPIMDDTVITLLDTNATGNASTVATATLETSGGTVVIHCAVAASGSDINMTNGLTIAAGDTVTCTSLTYTALSA